MKLANKIVALEAIATRARVNLTDIDESTASHLLEKGFIERDRLDREAVVLTDLGSEYYRKALH